jgi:putative DNA primase/helicase
MRMTGLSCRDAVKRIEEVAGSARVEKASQRKPDSDTRKELNALWKLAVPITAGDAVARYLCARIGPLGAFPNCLRLHGRLAYWDGGLQSFHPAILAKVSGPDGNPVNIHRTYLTEDGRKAEVPQPRKMMTGELPKGSAIRLWEPSFGPLGIAEGIETAMAVAKLFGIVCWSAVNSSMLAAWSAPAGVSSVVIFGDNDQTFGGQAAAFALAHRLACNDKFPIKVEVKIPEVPGHDWADVFAERRRVEGLAAA